VSTPAVAEDAVREDDEVVDDAVSSGGAVVWLRAVLLCRVLGSAGIATDWDE
jgi:hypothetical protein